jgi:hypothetical protein
VQRREVARFVGPGLSGRAKIHEFWSRESCSPNVFQKIQIASPHTRYPTADTFCQTTANNPRHQDKTAHRQHETKASFDRHAARIRRDVAPLPCGGLSKRVGIVRQKLGPIRARISQTTVQPRVSRRTPRIAENKMDQTSARTRSELPGARKQRSLPSFINNQSSIILPPCPQPPVPSPSLYSAFSRGCLTRKLPARMKLAIDFKRGFSARRIPGR